MPQPTDPLIAFTDPADPTGPVRLVYPAPNSPLDLAELAARTVPEGANTTVLSRGDLPGDRLFREAWRLNGRTIGTDLPAARTLWKNVWRAHRATLFPALDAAWMKATATGDVVEAQRLEGLRQQLRDVTQTDLNGAVTPQGIKAVWPPILDTAHP